MRGFGAMLGIVVSVCEFVRRLKSIVLKVCSFQFLRFLICVFRINQEISVILLLFNFIGYLFVGLSFSLSYLKS
jgi:hypothetical protein